MAKTEFRATLSICFEIQLRILYNLHMTYDKIYRRKPHVGTGCGGIQVNIDTLIGLRKRNRGNRRRENENPPAGQQGHCANPSVNS